MREISQRTLVAVVAGLVFAFAASICNATTLYWDGTSTAWGAGGVAAWSTSSSATTPNPSAQPTASDVAVFNISSVNSDQSIDLSANARAGHRGLSSLSRRKLHELAPDI